METGTDEKDIWELKQNMETERVEGAEETDIILDKS